MKMTVDELRETANTERLVNQYKDPDGNDPMTAPIPVWVLDKLASDSGKVGILQKELDSSKKELAECQEKITQLMIAIAKKDERIRSLSGIVMRQRQTIDLYEGMPVNNFFDSDAVGKGGEYRNASGQRCKN